MNGNPFYIRPMVGPELNRSVMRGLQFGEQRQRREIVEAERARRAETEARQQQRMMQAQEAALAALDANDPVAMQQAKIMFPEELKSVTTDMFTSPESEKLMLGGWKALYNNPEDAELIWNSIIARGSQLPGVDMSQSIADRQEWIDSGRDPELLKRKARTALTLFGEDIEPQASLGAPRALMQGMSPEEQAAFNAAYAEAGGGEKGIDAGLTATEATRENVGRQRIPQLVEDRFRDATDEQKRALQQRIMDADSLSEGLEQARELRTEQKNKDKGQTYVDRARFLITRILSNPQLADVLGAIEGQEERPWYVTTSDDESNAISDIREAQSILTKENLDLMSGVLSESDIKLLRELSSGALTRARGEQAFRNDAKELLQALGGPVGGASERIENPTPEEIAKMTPGTIFYINGRRARKD